MFEKDYDDIPGTYVYDGRMAMKGYVLNKMFMSFIDPANRERFEADEWAYMKEYGLSDEQCQAVMDRDLLRILQLGGNVYYVWKIAAIAKWNMRMVCANQAGMEYEDFLENRLGLEPAGDR